MNAGQILLSTKQKAMVMNRSSRKAFFVTIFFVVTLNITVWQLSLRPVRGIILRRCTHDSSLLCPAQNSDERSTTVESFMPPHPRIITLEASFLYNLTRGRRISIPKNEIERQIHPISSNDEAIRPPAKVTFLPYNGADYETGSEAEERCSPMASWQTQSFSNCNSMHELSLEDSIEEHLNLGEYRDVWRVNMGSNRFALKTLRLDNKKLFSPQRAEQHRIDAVASERLSGSRYVADIFGFCGQSVINGLGLSSGHFLRRMNPPPRRKLRFALDAARGIAATHSVDGGKGASLVHRDVRGPNFLVSDDGKSFMLHDFNCGRLIKWDETTNTTCAFLKQNCNPYRSPEECMGTPLTEKVDVYSLGNVFYEILTAMPPYTYPKKLNDGIIKQLIIKGTTPKIPGNLTLSEDPAIRAIIDAMGKCYTYDPVARPTAQEIADELHEAMISLSDTSR